MIVVINLLLVSWWTLKSPSSREGKQADAERGVDFDLGAFVLICAICALYAYLRLLADPSATMPQFSPLDNPLALKSQQFCLNYPEEVAQESVFVSGLRRSPRVSRQSTGRWPDNLGEICANKRVLGRIESWKLLTKLYLPLKSLQLLVSPISLSYDWPLESIGLVREVHDSRLLLALLSYVAIVAVILRWVRSWRPIALGISSFKIRFPQEDGEQKKRRQADHQLVDQLAWALVWLVVPYLPASNLLFPVGFLLAERTLYLPSFGFCLMVGQALGGGGVKWNGLWGKRKSLFSDRAKVGLVVLLALLGSVRIHERNADWLSNLTLFSSNVHQSPAKSVANLASLTAMGAANGSQLELAEQLYRRALEWQPNSPDLHYNL